MDNPFSLEGKTILVTGASSGIGRSIAIECSKMGAKLIITGRNEERLIDTYNKLEGFGHLYIIFDLLDIDNFDLLINQIPSINGIVNCAGAVKLIPFKFIKSDDLLFFNKLNYESPVLLTQKLFKKNKFEKDSSILFISSIMALVGIEANYIYSGTKSALVGFARSLSLDLAPKKIRVNCISPALVKTDLINEGNIPEDSLQNNIKLHPLGLGTPEDVAYASIYLLSDASRWITGTNLIIDGGYSAR